MAIKQTTQQEKTSVIHCRAVPFTIGSWTILQLPKEASAKLPSRGQVMVKGTINGFAFQTPLEPDGKWSHWFRITPKLSEVAGIKPGHEVNLEITLIKDWPEPEIPAEWQKALITHPEVHDLWQRITPMARWEWIRWARATNNSETYRHRIEVGISKLKAGERRPCCWNRNACSEPSVSKNGILLEPNQTKL